MSGAGRGIKRRRRGGGGGEDGDDSYEELFGTPLGSSQATGGARVLEVPEQRGPDYPEAPGEWLTAPYWYESQDCKLTDEMFRNIQQKKRQKQIELATEEIGIVDKVREKSSVVRVPIQKRVVLNADARMNMFDDTSLMTTPILAETATDRKLTSIRMSDLSVYVASSLIPGDGGFEWADAGDAAMRIYVQFGYLAAGNFTLTELNTVLSLPLGLDRPNMTGHDWADQWNLDLQNWNWRFLAGLSPAVATPKMGFVNEKLWFTYEESFRRFRLFREDPYRTVGEIATGDYIINSVRVTSRDPGAPASYERELVFAKRIGIELNACDHTLSPPPIPTYLLDPAWSALYSWLSPVNPVNGATPYEFLIGRRPEAIDTGAKRPRRIIVGMDIINAGYVNGTGSSSVLASVPVPDDLSSNDGWLAYTNGNDRTSDGIELTTPIQLSGAHTFRLYDELGRPYNPPFRGWSMTLLMEFV